MLIQGGGPPIADILGSLLSGAGNYIAGSENAKRQNAQLKMQQDAAAQNAQLTALSIANQKGQLRASGTNPDGSQAADPYTQGRAGVPDSVDPYYGPIAGTPAATTPDNINDHIAALLAAGQTGPAQNLRAGQQAQNAQTTFNNAQTTFNQGQQDRTASAATAAALQQFQSGLQYPANWNKMSPDQQIAYLQQRQNAAQRAGDTQTFDQTGKQITVIQGPQNLADKLQNQRDMLTQKLASADALQQARLIAALGRVGQGHPLTDYEVQSLQLQRDRFNAEFPGGKKPTTTRQAQNLTGEVESLRKQYDNFLYNNKVDTTKPQGRAQVQAWVQANGFSPDAIAQVVPFAQSTATSNPAAPVTTAPQANVLHNKSKSGKPIHSSDGGKTWVYD